MPFAQSVDIALDIQSIARQETAKSEPQYCMPAKEAMEEHLRLLGEIAGKPDMREEFEDQAAELPEIEQALAKAMPSPAQIEAGNYKKRKLSIHGLPISIENEKGSIRRGTDDKGVPWAVKMPHAYGYFKNYRGNDTTAADGDKLDVCIGPLGEESDEAHIINTLNPKTGEFDECKVMLGFPSREDAIESFKLSRNDDAEKVIGETITIPVAMLKEWITDGDLKGKASLVAKSHHEASQRTENGKVVLVAAYDDKRIKKPEEIHQERQPHTEEEHHAKTPEYMLEEAKQLYSRPETEQAYINHPATFGGRKLDVDIARELDPNFQEDPTHTAPIHHEVVSDFINRMFEKRMAMKRQTQNEAVLFLAGGGGSGKGTVEGELHLSDQAQTVLDGTMSKFESAKKKIDMALKSQRGVSIAWIYRPVELAVHGMVNRAHTGTHARIVPLDQMAKAHEGSPQVILDLMKEYANDPRVSFKAFSNSGGKEDIKEIPSDEIHEFVKSRAFGKKVGEKIKQTYNDIREKGYDTHNGTKGELNPRVRRHLDASMSALESPGHAEEKRENQSNDSGGAEGRAQIRKALSEYRGNTRALLEVFAKAQPIHVKSHYRVVHGKTVYVHDYDASRHSHFPEATIHERTAQGQSKSGTHYLRATDEEDKDKILDAAQNVGVTPKETKAKFASHHGRLGQFDQVHFHSKEDVEKVHASLEGKEAHSGPLLGMMEEKDPPVIDKRKTEPHISSTGGNMDIKDQAKELIDKTKLPPGYSIEFNGANLYLWGPLYYHNGFSLNEEIKALGGERYKKSPAWSIPLSRIDDFKTILDNFNAQYSQETTAKIKQEVNPENDKVEYLLTGNTFPHKGDIKAAGGKWDPNRKAWIMPTKKLFDRWNYVVNKESSSNTTLNAGNNSPESKDLHKYFLPSENKYLGFDEGGIITTPPSLKKKNENLPDYMKVVKIKSTYYREDGLSFGLGTDRGWMHELTLVPATEEESRPLREKHHAFKIKAEAMNEWRKLQDKLIADGEMPAGNFNPEGERLLDSQSLGGGGRWLVVGPEWTWFIVNNGSDGDDWSHNNIRTGGAGAIGRRVKTTPELTNQIKNIDQKIGQELKDPNTEVRLILAAKKIKDA